MIAFEIKELYFNWLYDIMNLKYSRESTVTSFESLFRCLHSIPFRWTYRMDENRAADGIGLRKEFYRETGYVDEEQLDGPCSVLEMMIALALRCENQIMDNPLYGDRSRFWFWVMVRNLGLGGQTDDMFNEKTVIDAVNKFLDHNYDRDGEGSLFYVRNTQKDHRKMEIWAQMSDYLNHFNGLV